MIVMIRHSDGAEFRECEMGLGECVGLVGFAGLEVDESRLGVDGRW
jgi:hypothetical protein